MGRHLLQVEMTPLYGLLCIHDPECSDVPQFETGEERVVANWQWITIPVRYDLDGPVQVNVVDGDVEEPAGELIFSGSIMLTGEKLRIGSGYPHDPNDYDVWVGRAGETRIKIFGEPANEPPHRVTVCIETADRST